jgi:hypothetical protein
MDGPVRYFPVVYHSNHASYISCRLLILMLLLSSSFINWKGLEIPNELSFLDRRPKTLPLIFYLVSMQTLIG